MMQYLVIETDGVLVPEKTIHASEAGCQDQPMLATGLLQSRISFKRLNEQAPYQDDRQSHA